MNCTTAKSPVSIIALAGACVGAFAATAAAQTNLFSNGSTDVNNPAIATGTTTASGVAAPANAQWSEVPHLTPTIANAVAGFSSHATGLTGAYRFADDFTVPGPDAWRLQYATVFAYQTDAPPGAPFSVINIRIWSGRPGEPGSHVVFGDTVSDQLIGSSPTGVYRVFNTASLPAQPPTTNRLIWRCDADLDEVTLFPGAYWLDWQFIASDPLRPVFSPPVTAAGSRGAANANALQFRPEGEGTWMPVIDAGKPASAPDVPQDLPFMLRGHLVCAADFNGDDVANSQDFFDFLGAFFESHPTSDFNRDGVMNSQDFFDFLTAFFACP